MEIFALNLQTGGCQDACNPAALGRVLPIQRAQHLYVPVQQDGGDRAPRGAGFRAIPGTQHERGAMKLEARQTLLTRPGPGRLPVHPALQSSRIAVAPEEVLIEWKEDAGARRLVTILEPKPMIAGVVFGDGMESVVRQFAVKERSG